MKCDFLCHASVRNFVRNVCARAFEKRIVRGGRQTVSRQSWKRSASARVGNVAAARTRNSRNKNARAGAINGRGEVARPENREKGLRARLRVRSSSPVVPFPPVPVVPSPVSRPVSRLPFPPSLPVVSTARTSGRSPGRAATGWPRPE